MGVAVTELAVPVGVCVTVWVTVCVNVGVSVKVEPVMDNVPLGVGV